MNDQGGKVWPKIFPTKLQASIIEQLLEKEDEFFTISQMARNLGASSSAISSRIDQISELGLIQILPAKRAKIFKLNANSKIVEILKEAWKKLKEAETVVEKT